MKDLFNSAFPPEVIDIMTNALEGAIATLPEPVQSRHVYSIAESILRTASTGERDAAALQHLALVELQLAPRTG